MKRSSLHKNVRNCRVPTMNTVSLLASLAALALAVQAGESAGGSKAREGLPGLKVRSEPARQGSRWDKNRDGVLDSQERKAMFDELQKPANGANPDNAMRLRSRLKKVGPANDRSAERIQRALGAK